MRLLQILDGEEFGGISKLMLEIGNNIKEDDIKIDYLSSKKIHNDIISLGISRNTLLGKIKYNNKLYDYLKSNNYDIVHINTGVFLFALQCVLISKKCNIKKIIVHSHSVPHVSIIKKKIINLLRNKLLKNIDIKLSCSKEAALSLYGTDKDVRIIKNGIDIDKFKYNDKERNKYRKKINIDNKKVYGHIGDFTKNKNYDFLIDIFYEIQKEEDAILLLIGNGELKEKIKEKVSKLNISSKVHFLGYREDINKLLLCMDVFLFPSLHEGLGLVLIEAQTSGLPVLVSENIPEEANISNKFIRINSYEIKEWLKVIKKLKITNRNNLYKNTIRNGYEIKQVSNIIKEIYKKCE